jgi:hypothetical protein
MYLAATDEFKVDMLEAISSLECNYNVSYQDYDAEGMIFPPLVANGLTTSTTRKTIIGVGTNMRQIVHIKIFNADVIAHDIVFSIQSASAAADLEMVIKNLPSKGTMEWSREGGWRVVSDATGTIVFTTFAVNGTYSPGSFKYCHVGMLGGGAGAGSGRTGIAGTNRFGGGGGGGGAFVQKFFTRGELPSSIAITIGTGGVGGAAVVAASTNGNVGTVGGDTSFGGIIMAKGGNPGGGGSTAAGTAGSGGQLTSCIPIAGPFSVSGANGAAGNTITNAAGITGFLGTGAPGGGGGGGINAANTIGVAANSGGAVYQNGTLIAGPVSGATPNGFDNRSVFLNMSGTLTANLGAGTGGAGGNPAFPNGGNGGLYGGGGGGGAGVLDPNPSGKGGNGAIGLISIMEQY